MRGLIKTIHRWYVKWRFRRFLTVGFNFSCGRGTIFYAKHAITCGENVYFGRYCSIETDAVIGNDVLIANSVAFVGRVDHAFRTIGVPVRHAPAIRDASYLPDQRETTVTVGDDVWIGYGAIVMSGVKIGHGAVVAAGSVVVHDVPAFSVVAGSPARVISQRFNNAEQETHMKLCAEKFSSYRRK